MRLEIRMNSRWRYQINHGRDIIPISNDRGNDTTTVGFTWTDSSQWRLDAGVGIKPASIFLNDTLFATATYAGADSLFSARWHWRLEDPRQSIIYSHQFMTPRYRVRIESEEGSRLAFMKMGCLKMWMVYRPSFAPLTPLLVLIVLKHVFHNSGLD